MTTLVCEVAVLGGGPAGSAAAKVLCDLGHNVILVERDEVKRSHIGEAFVPSISRAFDVLDLPLNLLEQATLRPQGVDLAWAQKSCQFRSFGDQPGYIVDRQKFDQQLLQVARAQGAQIIMGCRASKPILIDNYWSIELRHTKFTHLTAQYVVDATGKYSAVSGNRVLDNKATVAVYFYGTQQSDSCSLSHSIVASFAHGWLWHAPLPDQQTVTAVFLAREMIAGASKVQRLQLLTEALSTIGVEPPVEAQLQVCDASPSHAPVWLMPGLVRVGEASHAIDPLSSQGVQTALMSAWRGAVCLHNVMVKPSCAKLAHNFMYNHQQATVQTHVKTAGKHYNEAAGYYHGEFWQGRGVLETVAVRPEPDQRLRMSKLLSRVDVPVLENLSLEVRPGIQHPNLFEPAVLLGDQRVDDVLACLIPGLSAKENFVQLVNRFGAQFADGAFQWLCENAIVEFD